MTPSLRSQAFTEGGDLASRISPARRDGDWGGRARNHEEDLAWAAKRAAVSMAAATIHARDGGTGAHSDDVVHLCDAIADELNIYGHERAELLAAAQLHDVGKVAIPQDVLETCAPLNDEEWALIRQHTVVGEQIIQSVPELLEVGRLVRHSHERWDGAGYPDGLAGQSIPLGSRIVFCADAFHAIRADRPYRRGRSAQDALDEVQRNAGSQFDPQVADALVKSAGQMGTTVKAGSHGLMGTLRSRRLASLLLTLAIGGSALAAGGTHLLRNESDAGVGNATPASGSARDTAGDRSAPKRDSPATAIRAKRGDAGTSTPAKSTRRPPGKGTNGPAAEADSSSEPKREAVPAPAPAAPPPARVRRPLPAVPERARSGTPASPGRSGEAPRRPDQPGRPVGGAPGRSEEAPGRPSQPVNPPASQPIPRRDR